MAWYLLILSLKKALKRLTLQLFALVKEFRNITIALLHQKNLMNTMTSLKILMEFPQVKLEQVGDKNCKNYELRKQTKIMTILHQLNRALRNLRFKNTANLLFLLKFVE
jgi:hypothetical protein